jgi:Ca-activated chloride channel family protein
VAAPQPGVALQTLRTAAQAFGLLTLVPPLAAPTGTRFPRDLVVLLDISGSMSGAPLAQAQHVTSELIRSLTDADRLELLAFSSRTSAWQREPVAATAANRAAAEGWVRGLQASGGTEMHTAILQALAAVRAGVQRQIVLVTDGLIGFENEIVRAIRSGLPTGSRVHVVGVGSAPNRTLTRGASRAGHGIEVLIGLDEAPTAAAARLLARTAAPLVQDLVLSGSALLAAAPHALPDLCAGAPARLALQLRPEGGTLRVRGAGPLGAFVHELVVPPLAVGGEAAIARAFAREAVEDLEVELAATGAQQDVDARIEQLGLAHGIATRLTSWIAVAEQPAVDPRAVQRSVVVPNELPYGMAIEQLGLRAAGGACMAMPASMSFECAKTLASPPPPPAAPRGRALPSADDASFEMREEAAPREQERAAPKKRKDSLLRRMLDAVGGAKDAAGGKGEGGAGGGGPRATLRLQNASEWVFELTGLATWHAPVRVVVVFADGSERELAVDPARTTAAAPLTVAMLVRLVLLPDGAAPQRPVRLRLEQAGAILDVSVA